MSVFMDMLIEMLPLHSQLQKPDNPLRVVLDKSVGEYMDNISDIEDELFLTSASGGWLDAHGRDYGVPRRIDEDDESYRERIIFEKLEYLTAHNLQEIYGLPLYVYVKEFDATANDLTSDNSYITNQYLSIADEDLQNTLNKKFILDGSVLWYTIGEVLDYIIDTGGHELIWKYLDIYNHKTVLDSLNNYFEGNTNIESVKLTLPDCRQAGYMFKGCSNLENVKLYMPLIYSASSLAPLYGIFDNCPNIETIDIVIASSPYVTTFKNYVLGLELESLTSFKINGTEVPLS